MAVAENVVYAFLEEEKRTVARIGDREIGEATYVVEAGDPDTWIANHTYTDNEFRGQGIAALLLDLLVIEARKQGKKILPLCPYAVTVFKRNKQYQEIADPNWLKENNL